MGDTTQAMLPRICRIFVGFDVDSTNVPADVEASFDSTWDELGLLVKGGPTENAAWGQNTKLFARNGELVRVYRDEFSQTVDFGVHEWNDATRELMWPGSTDSKLYTPAPVPVKLAFEYREEGQVRRMISANYAEVMLTGAVTKAENALIAYPCQAEMFPDLDDTNAAGQPCIWLTQQTDDSSA